MAYNLKRKTDRQLAARQLAGAMLEAGATSADIRPAHVYHPRAINVHVVAPGGAYINVELDGDLPDVMGGTWNTPRGVWLSPALGQDVNPFHFGKLNVYTRDLEYLICLLEHHLTLLADGRGYLTEQAPQIVAMRARYEANGWHWRDQQAA